MRLFIQGKVVIVTGADGGLGKSITQPLLSRGATVVGTSRKIQTTDFQHPSVSGIPADIINPEGARGLIGEVLSQFGKLHVLASSWKAHSDE